MRWKGRQTSRNVEDRRGRRPSRGRAVGGGIGATGLLIAALVYFMGGDPEQAIQAGMAHSSQTTTQTQAPRGTNAKEDELAEFVSVVLKDTEDAWEKVFREQLGRRYQQPTLVIFTGSVRSACGNASASTGPFYCPGDQKLYIDLSFYDELKTRFRASGDFAMAYVVAHEVGHHVQYLMGTTRKVHNEQRRLSKADGNRLSVMLELQADFYAGLWAHHAQKMKNILENGDLGEALNAAQAIGDDRIQQRSRGYVVPESFTHGTSAQRKRWFQRGFDSGRMSDGDTFNAPRL